MGFWSKLGKIGLSVAPYVAAPFTGGASLSFVPAANRAVAAWNQHDANANAAKGLAPSKFDNILGMVDNYAGMAGGAGAFSKLGGGNTFSAGNFTGSGNNGVQSPFQRIMGGVNTAMSSGMFGGGGGTNVGGNPGYASGGTNSKVGIGPSSNQGITPPYFPPNNGSRTSGLNFGSSMDSSGLNDPNQNNPNLVNPLMAGRQAASQSMFGRNNRMAYR